MCEKLSISVTGHTLSPTATSEEMTVSTSLEDGDVPGRVGNRAYSMVSELSVDDGLGAEGGLRSGPNDHQCTADRESHQEGDSQPDRVVQSLNHLVLTVDAAFFTGGKALLSKSPAFEGVEKSHCAKKR